MTDFQTTQELATKLYKAASSNVQQRATRYYKAHKVEDLELSEGVLTAKVRGQELYEVSVDFNTRKRRCTCPAHKYQRGQACKHVLAALKPFQEAN